MGGSIEIQAFMGLAGLFRERGWSNPRNLEIESGLPGALLLAALDVPRDRVEALIVNHKTVPVEEAVLQPGDRIALVPPGVPGPHRFLLGIRRK